MSFRPIEGPSKDAEFDKDMLKKIFFIKNYNATVYVTIMKALWYSVDSISFMV